jgi:hypothetical protein
MKTWIVHDDDLCDRLGDPVPLQCECGVDALVPTKGFPGSPIIAIIGRAVVFDQPDNQPPDGWLPKKIECRTCGRIYGGE